MLADKWDGGGGSGNDESLNSFIAFNSVGDGGAGKESNENVDAIIASDSSGGGGSENIESVIHDGIASSGLNGDDTETIRSSWASDIVGVLGELKVDEDEACELSTEPRELLLLFGLRFNVLLLLLPPQLLLSSLRRRLWRRVNVPPRSTGVVGFDNDSAVESILRSFNCRVIDVNGIFGFIDGFRLIVPVGKSESNALFSSDKQPLELELDARDKRPFVLELLLLLFMLLLLLLPLLHCDGTDDTILPIDELRFDENLSSSSLAKSATSTR